MLRPENQPEQKGHSGDAQYNRYEHGRYLIGKPLNGRLAPLRIFHEFYDPRKRGLFAHSQRRESQATGLVDSPAEDHGARNFFNGEAFTGQHGFVDRRRA